MATSIRPDVVPAKPGKPEDTGSPAIADPGPLGLAAFAMTTFVLSVFNANIIGTLALVGVLLPLALFYGGAVQILAGMWEFRKNNTFGALAFSSYGAFWIALAWYLRYVAATIVPASREHEALGLFLLAWTIFTAYMLLASLRTTMMLTAVFAFLFATFLVLTIGFLAAPPNTTLIHVGGWLGLVTALLAWYHSAAGVTNATWGRTLLPVFPWKKT
jgi:succinate-acetate transporter protein